jgi:hypothetical protein
LPLFEETLKFRKAKPGADHFDTLITMNDLAEAYQAAERLDLALPVFEESLKIRNADQKSSRERGNCAARRKTSCPDVVIPC